MNLFKQYIHICNINFKKWYSDYRIWVLFILLSIFIFDYTNEILKFAYLVNYRVSPWIFPFIFTQKYMIRIVFIGVILLFCNAPFLDNNHAYIIIRSGKKNWNIGQIVYIFKASFIYFLFIMIITVVFNLRYMEFNYDWGKVLGTLGMSDVGNAISYKVFISGSIIKLYTPLSAMLLSFFISSLVGVLIGLIIYFINSFLKSNLWGVFIAIILVLIHSLTRFKPEILWISPISWSDLSSIGIDKAANMPTINFIFVTLFLSILTLILAIIFCSKKSYID